MSALTPVTLLGITLPLAYLAVVLLVLGTVLEAAYRLARGRGFDWRDALTNLVLYAGNVLVLALWSPVLFMIYDVLHRHALFDLSAEMLSPWVLVPLLVVAEDLCFYAFHRTSHRVRLLWAAHEPHHSSTSFNWSVALRQTWTPFLAAPFWFALPLLGFEPLMVLSAQLSSLVFQALLHTELVGRLGPVGWIFNTPGHHRLHHTAEAAFFDKNFGGIFIVWDRLFGTYSDGRTTRYGTGAARYNPLVVAFGPWQGLLRDVRKTRSLRILFRAPGSHERIDP